MKPVHGVLAVTVLALCFALGGLAQPTTAKKTHLFHGKVEAVNESAKSLRVNGEKVEGWMEAMTMDYKVDDPAVLKKVKAGDQIMATVYDGDLVLHKIEVTPSGSGDSKNKK